MSIYRKFKSKTLFSLNFIIKVFPKAPKLSAGQATLARQDTIDEGGEGDTSPPSRAERLALQQAERERLIEATKERNLALERERQIEMAQSRATTSDTYDTGLREQPPTLAQRDLIATVLDLKVDVRLEMQRMSQRISRIEDLLSELVKRLSQDSSGQTTPGDGSDAIPTIPTQTSTGVSTDPAISSISQGQSIPITTTPSSSANPALPTSSQLNMLNPASGSGGNGLGPILLKKRRSKSRKAPAPPKQLHASPDQTRLLEAELIVPQQSGGGTTTTITTTTAASGSGGTGSSSVVPSGSSGSGSGGGGSRTKREFL